MKCHFVRRLLTGSVLLLACSTIVCTFTLVAAARGSVTGDLAALNEARAASELNESSINTWEGEIEIIESRKEGLLTASVTSVATFAYNRATGDSTYFWKCVKSDGTTEDGKPTPGYCDGNEHGELIFGGILHKMPLYIPGPNRRRTIQTSKILSEPKKTVGPLEQVIVAKELLWHKRMPLSERLDIMRANSEPADTPFQLKITQIGTVVWFAMHRDDRVSNETIVIDLAKGAAAISASYQSNLQSEHYSTSLEKVNDVWVPKERHYVVEVPNQKRVERTMTWKINRVNVPLPQDRFSLDYFRAGHTFRITDVATGSSKVVGDGSDRMAK